MHKGVNTTMNEGQTMVAHALRAEGFDASEDGTGRGTPIVRVHVVNGNSTPETMPDCAFPLRADDGSGNRQAIAEQWAVRRLTPTECHRLQGFPDDHCRIPWRGKAAEDCPDGPQYKSLGNSMAVNAMCWIGQRIGLVEQITEY